MKLTRVLALLILTTALWVGVVPHTRPCGRDMRMACCAQQSSACSIADTCCRYAPQPAGDLTVSPVLRAPRSLELAVKLVAWEANVPPARALAHAQPCSWRAAEYRTATNKHYLLTRALLI